jgi:hypothetical protein
MTEAEWLSCDDPDTLLAFVLRSSTERKLLLYACCSFRRYFAGQDEQALRSVEAAEAYADGALSFGELTDLKKEALEDDWWERSLFSEALGSGGGFWGQEYGRKHAAWQTSSALVRRALRRKPGGQSRQDRAAREEARQVLLALVRCVLGNPFRPVPFAPSWRTPDVLGLAGAVYDEQGFTPERLAVLADALEEAGCTQGQLLEHLRGPGPHARGCWVVDRLLDRS